MAVSAFGPRGLLKKHPLLGTSLLADQSRAKEISAFRDLQAEAKGRGLNRSQMLDILSNRYSAYSAPEQSRLAQIASERSMLEGKMAGVRDPEQEKALTLAVQDLERQWGRIPEGSLKSAGAPGRTNAAEQWFHGMPDRLQQKYEVLRNMYGAYIDNPAAKEYALTEQYRTGSGIPGPAGAAEVPGSIEARTADLKATAPNGVYTDEYPSINLAGDEYFLATNPLLQKLLNVPAPTTPTEGWKVKEPKMEARTFAKEYTSLEREQANKAMADYEANVQKQVDAINSQYLPLGVEAAQRRSRLQERVDLYNMFLGKGY